MLNEKSSLNNTSADLEKEVIQRFRSMANCIPSDCQIFREPWDYHTVICLDFQACPEKLDITKKQTHLLMIAAEELRFGHSLVFRLGKKITGWTTVATRKFS